MGKELEFYVFSSWKEVDNVPSSGTKGGLRRDFYLGRDLVFIYF